MLVLVIESENQRSRSQRSQGKVGSVLFFLHKRTRQKPRSYLLSVIGNENREPYSRQFDPR